MDASALVQHYGLSADVAGRLCSRPAPLNNAYWTGKTEYLAGSLGYFFLPCIIDAAFHLGILRLADLDGFLRDAELILHYAALEESGTISEAALWELATGISGGSPAHFASQMQDRFDLQSRETSPSGLIRAGAYRRADSFLFAFHRYSDHLSFSSLCEFWTALMNVFLSLDDIRDLESDLAAGASNTITEAPSARVWSATLQESVLMLASINPTLSLTLSTFINHHLPVWNSTIKTLLSK